MRSAIIYGVFPAGQTVRVCSGLMLEAPGWDRAPCSSCGGVPTSAASLVVDWGVSAAGVAWDPQPAGAGSRCLHAHSVKVGVQPPVVGEERGAYPIGSQDWMERYLLAQAAALRAVGTSSRWRRAHQSTRAWARSRFAFRCARIGAPRPGDSRRACPRNPTNIEDCRGRRTERASTPHLAR